MIHCRLSTLQSSISFPPSGFKRNTYIAVQAALILSFQLAIPAFGNEYYVSQSNPSADDSNPGSETQPLKSIAAATRLARAGDTVWLGNGTYRETVSFAGRQSNFDPRTNPAFACGLDAFHQTRLLAMPGENPVVTGSDPVTGWVQDPKLPNVWSKSDWKVNSQQVFCDGEILLQIGGKMVGSLMQYWNGRTGDSVADLVPNSFYYDIDGKKLYVQLDGNRTPNSCQMEASTRPFLLEIEGDFTVISGIAFTHSTTSAFVNWPAVQMKGSFNLLDHCAISWSDFGGIGLGGNFNTVLDCSFNYCGDNGVGGGGHGNRLIRCDASYNNYRHWSAGWHAGGMKIIPYCEDMIVSHCTAHDNVECPGIWFDSGNSNCTVEDCVSHDNGGAGIMYEISERAVIKNNILYRNHDRGIYISNSHDCVIAFNTCYENGLEGIAVVGVDRKEGPPLGDFASGLIPARNNVIWGNILVDDASAKVHKDQTGSTGPATELILPNPHMPTNSGCVSEYNVFYRSDNRPLRFCYNWGDENYVGLSAWTKATKNDVHSITADPLFVDAAGHDFHLKPTSPAAALALPLNNPRDDFAGAPRPLQAFGSAGPYQITLSPTATVAAAVPVLRGISFAPQQLTDLSQIEGAAVLAPAFDEIGKSEAPALNSSKKVFVLDAAHPTVTIPINQVVHSLNLFHALVKGDNVVSQISIYREDGMTLSLPLELGKNIAHSLGTSPNASIFPTPDTRVYWSSPSPAAEIFETTWKNENEWYPVKSIEWTLKDPKAVVLILGIDYK